MVWIAQARAQPCSCALLPAPARPVRAYWEAAQAEYLDRPRLPAISLPPPTPPALPCCQEGWAAALPLPPSDVGSHWAQQGAFMPLAGLRGPANELCCEPHAVQLPSAPSEPFPPPFLLPRLRTPHMDEWQRRSTTLADEPCLPILSAIPMAEGGSGGLAAVIAQECGVEQEAVPELPQVDREAYRFQPQPVQLPTLTPCGAKPFSVLEHLLQQAPSAPLAPTEQPLLDVPLPQGGGVDPQATAPRSLRRKLERLAADGGSPQGCRAAEAAAAGFVGLRSLQPQLEQPADEGSRLDRAAALLSRLAAAPTTVLLQRLAPAIGLPSFLLSLPQTCEVPADPASSPAAAAAKAGSTHQLFLIEPPVLPAAAAVRGTALVSGAPTSAFSHLFQPVPVPAAPTSNNALCLAPEGCQPVSLATLVAHDIMNLDGGGGLMLPPVQVELPGEADSPAPALLPLIQSECGCKPANTAHLALHLNWSLSSTQAALRPPELNAVLRSLRQQMLPRPAPLLLPAEVQQEEQQRQARVIRQLLVPFTLPGQQQALVWGAMQSARIQAAGADVPAVVRQPPGEHQQAAGPTAGLPKEATGPPPTKRSKRGGAADMQYFLRLQRGAAGGGAAGAASSSLPCSSSSGDASAEEAVAEHLERASTAVHSVELHDVHAHLLRLLRDDEQRLVAAAPAPGVPTEVASSDFLSVDVLQRALQGTAGQPGSRDLIKLYATMTVIRQTATTLVHHGVRCAHLYLAQSQSELPGLLSTVTAAQELRAANRQVEAGQVEDSPKLAALQRLLAGIAALSPGAKCCIIGHPKSFFTLYRAVLAAGQTVCQLDRNSALAVAINGTGSAGKQLAAAVEQACASAGCVLVPVGLACSGQFPWTAFQQVVVYASEPATQTEVKLHLSQLACPLHMLEVPLLSFGTAGPQQEAPAAAAPRLGQQGGPAGVGSGPPKLARVKHAARTAPPATAAHPAPAAASKDWPLIISSDPCRPIRSSRPLYEAVLALEQQGAAVVERPLSLVDLVLSPSAGLVVCDNSAAKLEFDDFVSALAPLLSRLSFAFARVVLVCEGSPGFQAQVLCSTERLLALGRRAGLRLQCHATTSAAGTALVVTSVARAWLAKWQAVGRGMQYVVAEAANDEEAFLSRFYSLNPHSASLLLSLGLPLAQLLRLAELSQLQLPKVLALIPRHCLELFCQCAAYGQPALGIPTASVMHPAQQNQQAYGTPPRPQLQQLLVEQADSCVPAAGEQQQVWEQQQQWHHRQQQLAAAAVAAPPAPCVGGIARYGAAAAGHVSAAPQQAALQVGHIMYAPQAAKQAPQAAYLAAQLEGQQARGWDSCYEPHVQMNEAVYQRGMQLMQARLRGALLPQQAIPTVLPQHQHQHQQHIYSADAHALAAAGHYQQQLYENQQLHQQQLLLHQEQEQRRRQLELQQQAEAAAFPELPGLEEGAGVELGYSGSYPSVQPWQQPQGQAGQYSAGRQGGHTLPPPAGGGRLASGLPPSGAAYGAVHVQNGHASTWRVGQERGANHCQPQQAGVDEFGVSVQPSMSDDESDNAAVQQQQQQQQVASGLPGRGAALQQMQQLLLHGRSGSVGAEGGQMAAFLGSRKRDFSVPRSMTKAPAPAAAHRGAGQVTLADAEGIEDDGGGPAAKRQRGIAASGQFNNLLRPAAGRGGGTGATKRGGPCGGRWGGGGRRYAGRFGGGRGVNKPSRAW